MDAKKESLTAQQLLDAVENNPLQEPAKSGLSAIAAIKAMRAHAEALATTANKLLDEIFPEAFQFLAEANLLQKKSKDSFQQPSDVDGLTWGQVVARIEGALNEKSNSPVSAIKRAYHLARVRSWLYPSDGTQASEVWQKICQAGYLSPMEHGPVVFENQPYGVDCQKFSFEPQDANEIVRLSQKVCDKIASKNVAHNNLRKQEAPVQALEKVSAEDVWFNHAFGKFELSLSPNGNGSAKKLFMESRPSDKNGPVLIITDEKGLPEFHSGESISLSAIQDEEGALRDGLKVVLAPCAGTAIAERQIHLERLSNALKDGFRLAIDKESSWQEIAPVDFLCGSVGKSDVGYPDVFKWEPKDRKEECAEFENLVLRWARDEEGQVALLSIVSGGKKAKKLFGSHIGKFQDPGENFWGVEPFVCGLFLRACYKKLVLEIGVSGK